MISGVNKGFVLQQNLVSKTGSFKKEQEISLAKNDSKVENIAKAIAEGTYKIDLKGTAKAIVDTLV